MGAKHCSPEEIKEFIRLYEKYGTYSAVAEATGRSAGAVRNHLKVYYATLLKQEQKVEKNQTVIINVNN